MHNNRLILLTIVLLLFTDLLKSQNYLAAKVNIPHDTYQTNEILKIIEGQTNARFSYNTEIIDVSKKFEYQANDKTVEQCLKDIFQNTLTYKTSGRYIVLMPLPAKESSKEKVVITGKITDQNNNPLKLASVYNLSNQFSTTTDENGEFELQINADQQTNALSFAKNGYDDTVVVCTPKVCQDIEVSLNQEQLDQLKSPVQLQNKSVDFYKFVQFLIPLKNRINSINLEHIVDTAKFQFSILPYLSTNLAKQGVLYNNISLNLLIGYSKGTNGAEIAGLINIDKENVKGIQVAGISNFVGGEVNAIQTAGFSNINLGNTQGVQVSGFVNANAGDMKGLQASSFLNGVVGNYEGVQVSGFANVNKGKMKGVQVASFINFNYEKLVGTQISGFTNVAIKQITGTQITGFANFAIKNIKGAQISGFGNICLDSSIGPQITGFANISKAPEFQLSGFANIAYDNQGVQIAPFNLADTSSGVSIGFFSFIYKGLHKFIVSSNELNYINLSFVTGNDKFYNIFKFSIEPQNQVCWGVGYGFGHKFIFSKTFKLNADFTANLLNYNTFWNNVPFIYENLNLNLEIRFFKHFSVYFGPRIGFYSNYPNKNVETLNYIDSRKMLPVAENTIGNTFYKSWLGWNLGFSL